MSARHVAADTDEGVRKLVNAVRVAGDDGLAILHGIQKAASGAQGFPDSQPTPHSEQSATCPA